MRTTLLSFAWVAVCAAFVGLFFGIELDLNFFSWSGKCHFQSVACMIGLLILLVSSCFLSIASRNSKVLVIACITCVMLMGAGIWAVAPEAVVNPGQWLSRSSASPNWYRWGRLTVACLPLFIISALMCFRRVQD